MFEVQQTGHQPNRQLGSTGVARARAFQHHRGAEHVVPFEDLARVFLALELGRQRRFDLSPGKPPRKHRQRIVEVCDFAIGQSQRQQDCQDPRALRRRAKAPKPARPTARLAMIEGSGTGEMGVAEVSNLYIRVTEGVANVERTC